MNQTLVVYFFFSLYSPTAPIELTSAWRAHSSPSSFTRSSFFLDDELLLSLEKERSASYLSADEEAEQPKGFGDE